MTKCTECGKPSEILWEIKENGKKKYYCKICKEIMERQKWKEAIGCAPDWLIEEANINNENYRKDYRKFKEQEDEDN